ncbi:MAG: hypothetical protein JWO12_1322, partial [Frankiales bacterium]|nr:hypothetical protein [Frankiales bacterium]
MDMRGDLESELQRLLRTRDVPLPVLDPVPAVHAGIRRRRRTQRLQVATSGLAVAALAFAASVVVNDHLGASQKPPT